MRHILFAIIACISCEMLAANNKEVKTLHFDIEKLSITSVKCENESIYSRLEYEGINTKTEDPGHPALPIYFMNVPLPLGATNIEVEILNKDILTLSLDYPVIPVQEPATSSLLTKEPDFFWPNEELYSKDSPYPDKAVSVAWTSNIAGVSNEATIALYPIVYQPRQNKVDFLQSMTIAIRYSIEKKNQNKRAIQSLSSIGLPFFEYCIITRDSLIPSFERIIAWKRTKGIDAGAVSIESILSNSFCYGDSVSGINDDAGKIRQYLQYANLSGKGKYVFFGGDDSILPIRYGTKESYWINDIDSVEFKVPSDQYFSELNSDWNQDNDNHYGEPFNNMDYGPELFVGRLLCENRNDIENNTDKLLRYERNPGNGDFGYLRKAFYCQSDQMQNDSHAQKLIATSNYAFTTNTILEELPSFNAWNPTFPSGTEVIEAMNDTHYGYLNWLGHGHPLAICTKSDGVRQSDSVYGITPVQTDSVPYTYREEGHGLDNLNNRDYPAIAYSTACTITPFDSYLPPFDSHPNIGQSFTMGKDYGGPALIGNTRVGYIDYSYRLQKLFNGGIKSQSLGEALFFAKMNYNSFYKHLTILTVNLIGCPELHMWTNIPNYFGNIVKSDSNTYDTNLSFTAYSDTVEVAVRDVWGNDDVALYTFHPSYSNLTIPNSQGKLITLKALNHIPEILNLENGSAIVHGRRYVYASSATLGGEANSTFTIDNDADITIEKTGVLRLSGGFKVKQGARFVVR